MFVGPRDEVRAPVIEFFDHGGRRFEFSLLRFDLDVNAAALGHHTAVPAIARAPSAPRPPDRRTC
ncbi:hypothetical protein ACFWYW_44475 [Nonomuraea sp. NPDC059023]|uniref:hypothetical protein n=1 Tax=unclassified Nonomuraea TaxID=2593643 RepID=UPI00369C41E7